MTELAPRPTEELAARAAHDRESDTTMKQVAQNYKTGELVVLDVPPPACLPDGVLVRSLYSLISTGTEVMKVSEANLSLLGKARARPDQVRKLLDSVAQQGVHATYVKAMSQLDAYTPLGYSLCGVVVDVGRGAEEFNIGQVVACGGNEYALHAELNWVPRNLCVPVPDGVDPRLAAFATVGAIALHGVRRAEPQLGETACVVGLGLVGQLAVELLVAAGVHVVGLDLVPARCRLAERAGAVMAEAPDGPGIERVHEALSQLTGGLGADHVLLTAGGSSNVPVEVAARLARDRARVVDIGKLKLDLPWNAYYEKELDVRFSRSYGPGRYDDTYERQGVDYPAGYVRWTERRNLSCFLDLVARSQLPLDVLVSGTFPVTDAAEVYGRLRSGALGGVGYLFEYPEPEGAAPGTPGAAPVVAAAPGQAALGAGRPPAPTPFPVRPVPPAGTAAGGPERGEAATAAGRAEGRTTPAQRAARLRVGFIGAGNYASSMLLPHLASRGDVELAHVATNRSLSAVNAQRRFGFAAATTDVDALLADESIEAVFIVTRHHSHADLVCRALRAGKATFVEKPLALDAAELGRIEETVGATGNDRLMVGFNRRFAPLLVDLHQRFGEQPDGMLHYLVNAGPLGASSWYANEQLEGARFVGEGGHFLDTMAWWFEAQPVTVTALSSHGRDDLHVAVRFDDDAIGNLDYVTRGNPRYPKETFEVSSGRRTARFENFRRATIWRGMAHRTHRAFGPVDKGQRQMLARFVDAARSGSPMPIPLASLLRTTSATLAVGRSLETGATVVL